MNVIIRNNNLIFKENYKMVSVSLSEVVFFESMGHYILLRMKNGTTHTARCAMCELAAMLEGMNFLRAHRGVLVNLGYVIKVKSTELLLDSIWERVPMSRRYKEDTKKAFEDYCILCQKVENEKTL